MQLHRNSVLAPPVLTVVALLSVAQAARSADVVLQDDALVDYRIEQGELTVRENDVTNVSPTVTFIEPGYVDFQTSVLDASTFLLVGGELHDRLNATDSSTVTIAGGSVGEPVTISENASLFMADGTLSDYLIVRGDGTATVAGGTLWGISAQGDAFVTLAGGLLTASGGELGLSVDEQSIIQISGTDFNYPIGPIADTAGTLTGFLANGDPISVPFARFTDGSIVLVPEPGTMMLLLPAMMALAVMRRNGRHQMVAV